MELTKNQVVVFENGERQGYLEARWSERDQAFYTFIYDEDAPHGKRRIYSTTIEEKPARKSRKFVPSAATCTVRLNVDGETEKAYKVCVGTNGCVSKANMMVFYEYVAKSICYVDDEGNVFCPVWAKTW